jgi:hypothetical protein
MRAVLHWLGVDVEQWTALVITYLRMDLRRTGGAVRFGEHGRRNPLAAHAGLLVISGFASATLAALAIALRDTFTVAALVTTYVAFNTGVLLLVDFTSLVVSPVDYHVLSSRPVDSRTYLAARLASVLVYVTAIAAVMVSLPSLVLAIWHGLGLEGAIGVITGTLMCSASMVSLTIAVYAWLVSRIRPDRFARVLSYLQVVASSAFLGGYYLVTLAFEESRFRDLSIANIGWVWAVPSTWFAAFVPVLTGSAGTREAIAAVAALVLAIVCVPLGTGRLSLDYAEHLSEISAASAPASARPRLRIPGFRQGEAFAIALLVRAQFRHDSRFRLAVLGLLPIVAFYILAGIEDGSAADPFVGLDGHVGAPLYIALTILPMTLHSSLLVSDNWRSAWIFFATPSDPARLIVAAKNFVALFFLGGYVFLLALLWSFLYQKVWHALVHAAVLGLIAHFLLQGAAILHPALPFSAEPHRAERSSQMMGLLLVGGIISGIVPFVLPYCYARTSRIVVLAAVLLATTFALEHVVRIRARESVSEMEFWN